MYCLLRSVRLPQAFGRDFHKQKKHRNVSHAIIAEFLEGATVRIENTNRRVDPLSEVFLLKVLE